MALTTAITTLCASTTTCQSNSTIREARDRNGFWLGLLNARQIDETLSVAMDYLNAVLEK
jgi:hypothetical protein